MRKILILFISLLLTPIYPSEAIINGENGGFGITVTFFKNKTDKVGYCSGTIISPKIVIASGHCESIAKGWWVGRPDFSTNNTFGRVSVARTLSPYMASIAPNPPVDDIRIVVLSQAMPVRKIRIATEDQIKSWINTGQEIYAIGYGYNNTVGRYNPHPYYIQGNLIRYTGNTATAQFTENTGVCPGDSGGSLISILDDNIYYIGAISYVNFNMCDLNVPRERYGNSTAYIYSYYKSVLNRS